MYEDATEDGRSTARLALGFDPDASDQIPAAVIRDATRALERIEQCRALAVQTSDRELHALFFHVTARRPGPFKNSERTRALRILDAARDRVTEALRAATKRSRFGAEQREATE